MRQGSACRSPTIGRGIIPASTVTYNYLNIKEIYLPFT